MNERYIFQIKHCNFHSELQLKQKWSLFEWMMHAEVRFERLLSKNTVTCLKIFFDQSVSFMSFSKCFEMSSLIWIAILSISSSSCNIKNVTALLKSLRWKVQMSSSLSNFSFGLQLICKYNHISANVLFDISC